MVCATTGEAVKQAIIDKLLENLPDIDDLSLAAIAAACATATRDAILNRVLAGNHDTVGTAGKLLQNADVRTSTRSTLQSTDIPTDYQQRNVAVKLPTGTGEGQIKLTAGEVETSNPGGLTESQIAILEAVGQAVSTIGVPIASGSVDEIAAAVGELIPDAVDESNTGKLINGAFEEVYEHLPPIAIAQPIERFRRQFGGRSIRRVVLLRPVVGSAEVAERQPPHSKLLRIGRRCWRLRTALGVRDERR